MGIVVIFIMYMLQAFVDKSASKYTKGSSGTIGYGLVKNSISAIIALCVAVIGGMALPTSSAILISLLAGISQAICTVFILLALQKYSIMQVNLFMTASILVPTICGMFLFSEEFTIIKALLIVVIILSSGLILGINKLSDLKMGGKNFILLIIVWLFYGAIMLAQKMYAKYIPDGNSADFSFYMYTSSCFTLAIMSLIMKIKNGKKRVLSFPRGKLLYLCIVAAVIVFIMNQTLTELSASMPSYILFPLTNGGKLVFVLIISALVFKEKPTKKMIAGCLLMITSVLLL